MKLVQITGFIVFICGVVVVYSADNNAVERICQVCGDIVNDYCCRFYQSCCEYLRPSGCPNPSSPEARMSCKTAKSCRTNADCPMFRQCCDTSICGTTCMEVFSGYRY